MTLRGIESFTDERRFSPEDRKFKATFRLAPSALATPVATPADSVDERAIVTDIRKAYNARRREKAIHQAIQGVQEEGDEEASAEEEIAEELGWKQTVLATMLAISPDAFERLSQRLLRGMRIYASGSHRPIGRRRH